MDFNDLVAALPLERRLALSYAPARARTATLALLSLDSTLGGLVRSAHEPLLCQLRLAWWREELAKPIADRARGEPTVAALAAFGEWGGELRGLVDGWEALLGDAPLHREAFSGFVAARGNACTLLASAVGAATHAYGAQIVGVQWALAELGTKISDPREREIVGTLAGSCEWQSPPLPRSLRSLKVLNGLAVRSKGELPLLGCRRDILAAFRLGLLGI